MKYIIKVQLNYNYGREKATDNRNDRYQHRRKA